MAEKKYLDYDGLTELVKKIKSLIDDVGHFVFKGTVTGVAALPTLANATVGWVYTVTSADTTTTDFMEGAGKAINANDEVICVKQGTAKKWAILGPVFDVSDRLQFGSAMPTTSLTDGRVFLYLGATTYKDVYTAVTPEGTENPSTEGWYETDGSAYTASTDTTVDASKTYYIKTQEEEYVKGVIYKYDLANTKWVAQSAGDTMTAITNAEVDALFD